MNVYVVAGVIAVLIGLNVLGRRRPLPFIAWMCIWPIAIYVIIRYGITPNVPASVLKIYLWLTVAGLFAYLNADDERFAAVAKQVTAFMVEPRFTLPLYAAVVLLPAGVAAKIYSDHHVAVRAPTFGRTIHPAPPGSITFKGKPINLLTQSNPYRELEQKDPAKFREHVEAGRAVYYQNCVYCHGDDMGGDGMFAHALEPVPASFNSATTISMLQEAYLFWRIAKGGPGLPEESGPWSSSMPAWENFLDEEQIWNVILFLYDYTGNKPRAEETEHH